MKLEVIIGLEFHVQLMSKTKMFCSCSNDADGHAPNSLVCPICLGHPGTLPVVNGEAMKMAMKMALALNTKINNFTKFDRKNYFYPDLPKGYQISQFDKPLGEHGYYDINYKAADGLAGRLDKEDEMKRIRINRLHVEEDSAKSIHDGEKNATLVDFNRGGSPLAEIVTEADLSSPKEAKTLAQEMQSLARQLGISEASMEKGQLRCDANISLRPEGEKILYPKTEIKNLNSFKSIERALEFEVKRQKALWLDGKAPKHETTRGFDDKKQITMLQRTKEIAADYRFFPEPDIPPVTYTEKEIEDVRRTLGELPQAKRYRFMNEFNLPPEDVKLLTHETEFANYTEKVISELQDWVHNLEGNEMPKGTWKKEKDNLIKLTANWLINNLLSQMSEKKIDFPELKVTAENFAELITLIFENKLNSTNAQKILDHMVDKGSDPSHVMDEFDMSQVDNDGEIEAIIETVITNFPEQAQQFRDGKESIIKFLLGQVMRESKGKVNPQKAEEILQKKLI